MQTEQGKQCVYSDRPATPIPEEMEEEGSGEPVIEDASTFMGELDLGPDLGSFTPTGTIDEVPPPEPISGCQCDQTPDQPLSENAWLICLFGLASISLRRRK